jgi:hypothetical protein
MLRERTWWFTAALVIALLNATAYASQHQYDSFRGPDMVRLPGHVLPALSKATVIPSKSNAGNRRITLTLVLKLDDEAGFKQYLSEIYDPTSPNFQDFLDPSEISRRFGPSKDSYEAVLEYLKEHGFKLIEGSKDYSTISVAGRRSDAEQAFAVKLGDYQIGKRKFYANQTDPALPPNLASRVQAVIGLNDLPEPNHGNQSMPIAAKWSAVFGTALSIGLGFLLIALNAPLGLAFLCLCLAIVFLAFLFGYSIGSGGFSFDQRHPDQLDADPAEPPGSGQTVGLIEFDTFQSSDVSNYLSMIAEVASAAGVSSGSISNLSVTPVNGGATPGANQDEVLIDIDDVMTVAPGAKVAVYDAPFSGAGSFQAVLNAMIDGGVSVISNSWAYCEDQTTLADVQSIDSLLQKAAVAGISVFSGSGDGGSTCLDGSPNTIGVPADSPNLTAVGGTTLSYGPGLTYGGETWWNGTNDSPPTGQGGFGTSRFFAAPSYQGGAGMRTIPDVVVNADPATGMLICQASNGGCPNGNLYGGTSMAAPSWAAFAAILNQATAKNQGFFNPLLYPLANTSAFHNPGSMGSDFTHVGLGSPNLGALLLDLTGQSPGPVSASASSVAAYVSAQTATPPLGGVPADGQTQAAVNVLLADEDGNAISGKTVTLSASSGSHAVITPPSAVTNVTNGAATFTVTDDTPESITFTGTDSTDGITVTKTATVPFVVPEASSAGIGATPTSVTNNGTAATTITVTLKDSQGRPTPGKLVQISQTGNSVINGPNPPVSDSNGMVVLTATDQFAETVTYSGVDVTDGNLPIPGPNPSVTFSGMASNTCAPSSPPAAPGYVVTPYATGFVAAQVTAPDGFPFGCMGVSGIAFDSAGNLYANDSPTGNIYKIPSGGGAATTPLNATSLGATLTGLAFDKNDNLFASFGVTGTHATIGGGSVVQLDPSNGTISKTISSSAVPLTCPTVISIDPLSGDLFTDDTCFGEDTNSTSIWRISGPAGASPSTSVYASTTNTPNSTLAFAPGGTIYMWTAAQIAQVSGTNVSGPPSVTILSGLNASSTGMLAGGSGSDGDGTFLIENPFAVPSGTNLGIQSIDLTTSPSSSANIFTTSANGANTLAFGPDGCLYVAQETTVYRISDPSGECSYGSTIGAPTLTLTPTTVSPNPTQGTSQSFSAALHYASVPDGTPVFLNLSGANQSAVQGIQANTVSDVASFNYTGVFTGVDNLKASETVSSSTVTSNPAVVTWTSGAHTTFVGINQNPTGGAPGQMVNLVGSLTDVSVAPAAPVSGQTLDLAVGGASCNAPTNSSGIASCGVTLPAPGTYTLSGSFAGTASYLASSNSQGFNVLTAPTPTATATPTVTPTATPSATPTPGGLVTVTGEASGGGKPGATVDLGSFSYKASDNKEQTVSSVSVSVSRPNIFSSLTLVASINGDQVGTATLTSPIGATAVFTFSSPIALPAGDTLTFALSGVISGGASASLDLKGEIRLAGITTAASSRGEGGGGSDGGLLMIALAILGCAILPMRRRQRLRASILALAMLMLAVTLVACSGSSGGAPSPNASAQEVDSMNVTEGSQSVTVSGLPADLGKIRKE